MSNPVEDALKVIQSRPEGVLQSELWKILDVDSRKCSRIVKKLLETGLVERAEFKREGIKTYLLRAKQRPIDPGQIMAGDELVPCIGCDRECIVEECTDLMDWMYELAICEKEEPG
ncbi:MAG: Lrp/AsnC family transcriptional regulator [Methanoregulaceae archaeon]|nr:Lrp/AsnC family transcriptional regulator [Methanoregulaceae archaeon]